MAYHATVYRVLIASPSDLAAERKALPEVIYSWNATHSEDFGVVLLPVLWETHSAPEMGDRPQAIIDRQLVQSCDVLVGAFWTRIGTHTGVAESGTVEEIDHMRKAGKPVMLYFSSAPVVPDSVDTAQYERLRKFRAKCESEGLIERYSNIQELREKLNRHLTGVVRQMHGEPTFEQTENDQALRATQSLREQLQYLVARHEVDWSTERDSKPVSIEEAKSIVESLKTDLVDFRAGLTDKVDDAVLKEFDTQITQLKSLRDHSITMDGGQSYKAFWAKGDEILRALRDISPRIQPTTERALGLDTEKVQILRYLGMCEDAGRGKQTDRNICDATRLSLTVVRFHLRELEGMHYVSAAYVMMSPTTYSLTHEGREYVIKNKLLESENRQ
jgi:DNA-binding transcriptional ArsR family regulator